MRLYLGCVHEFDHSSTGLEGSILIAHPQLPDPNFKETVIFISAHNPLEGTFGLILNRPVDRDATLFLPNQDLGSLAHAPVFIGGPVARGNLIFALFEWDEITETVRCHTHLGVEEARDFANDDPRSIRAFIGYTGWTAGQIEKELAEKSWFVQKADIDILDEALCGDLWNRIIKNYRSWLELLAEDSDDSAEN